MRVINKQSRPPVFVLSFCSIHAFIHGVFKSHWILHTLLAHAFQSELALIVWGIGITDLHAYRSTIPLLYNYMGLMYSTSILPRSRSTFSSILHPVCLSDLTFLVCFVAVSWVLQALNCLTTFYFQLECSYGVDDNFMNVVRNIVFGIWLVIWYS